MIIKYNVSWYLYTVDGHLHNDIYMQVVYILLYFNIVYFEKNQNSSFLKQMHSRTFIYQNGTWVAKWLRLSTSDHNPNTTDFGSCSNTHLKC